MELWEYLYWNSRIYFFFNILLFNIFLIIKVVRAHCCEVGKARGPKQNSSYLFKCTGNRAQQQELWALELASLGLNISSGTQQLHDWKQVSRGVVCVHFQGTRETQPLFIWLRCYLPVSPSFKYGGLFRGYMTCDHWWTMCSGGLRLLTLSKKCCRNV